MTAQPPTVEVAFGVNPGDEPTAGDWTDLSSRVRRLSASLGQARLGSSPPRANIRLDNRDRTLDPSSPAAVAGLLPMRHARITVAGTPVFRGFVDSWPLTWPDKVDVVTDIQLVDAAALLATIDFDLDLPRQPSHDRINAILDVADWPEARRDIEPGVVWLDASEQVGANVLRCLQDAADGEDGAIWVAQDGTITFRSRHDRLDRDPVETFGPSGIGVRDAEPDYDSSRLTNVSRVELESGDIWEAFDPASAAQFGHRSEPVRDVPLAAVEARGLAEWNVYRYSTPNIWVDRMAMRGLNDADLASVLSLELGSLVEFSRPFKDGSTFEYVGHVERIAVDATPNAWDLSVDLSPYFGAGPWAGWVSAEAEEGSAWVSEEATEGSMWAP